MVSTSVLIYILSTVYSAPGAVPKIPVMVDSVLKLFVAVDGSETAHDLMIFDTGSQFSWLFYYRLLQNLPTHNGGGYSISRLRTAIQTPEGGDRIKYVDEDLFESKVWTRKKFSLGDHSWMQSFGVVHKATVRKLQPNVTGLIGASRNSEFASIHRTFGFTPRTPTLMGMNVERVDPSKECHDGTLTSFPLVGYGTVFEKFWTIKGSIRYGGMVFNGPILMDTGSSVIALPHLVFESFAGELVKLGIQFRYYPGRLHGAVRCSDAHRLPDWSVIKDRDNVISITKQMYVKRTESGTCLIFVCELQGEGPIILGTPLLGHYVSEFDGEKGQIGLCRPKQSWVSDFGPTAFGYPERLHLPSSAECHLSFAAMVFLGFYLFH